jgi:hypothetical protein
MQALGMFCVGESACASLLLSRTTAKCWYLACSTVMVPDVLKGTSFEQLTCCNCSDGVAIV